MASLDKALEAIDCAIANRLTSVSARDLLAQVQGLWTVGMPPGAKTGWPTLDKHYTVMPGQVTILTGWPSSGKSEWLDALLVNLSRQGWKLSVFSPENHPLVVHVTKLTEKITGKPFGHGPTARVPFDEIPEVLDEISESFSLMEKPDGEGVSVNEVLTTAWNWLEGFPESPKGLVIDPWNELEHARPPGLSETEYISQTLSKVRHWARARNVHVWIVAHPQKLPQRNDGSKLPIPRPDMISGSQNWWNKGDCCVTVYRDVSDSMNQEVEIHVQKVRFKHIGRAGVVLLNYDRITGRYHEPFVNLYATGRN